MGKRNMRNPQPEILRQIRNNVRKGNFSRVSNLVMSVLRRDDSDQDKQHLMKIIYREAIETWIERTIDDEPIPKQYENMLLEYARYEQGQGNLERTLEVLGSIKESENPKTRKKVSRQINLINLAQELSKGENIDVDIIDKIALDIERDVDSRTYMELISSVFGKEFSIDKLSLGELEKYIKGEPRTPLDIIVDPVKGTYSEELKVENRMKFFKDELDIEPNIRFCDEGIFAGSILLSIKDTDLVLVEKVIDMYADGTYEPNNYASSTYILPQDKVLDLIRLQTREKVKAQLKGENLGEWKPIQHRETWKENIKEAIERGKTRTTREPEQEQPENVSTTRKPEFKMPKNNMDANREFLKDINTNLDGILTDKIIEQLVRRTASYSFESVYDNRLKEKLFKSLEVLEVPAEQMDAEAKKIFLVMRMTMDGMSKLKSKAGSEGGIPEEELAFITEQYTCYYDEALLALKSGIAQGMDYKEIAKAMKDCIPVQDIVNGKKQKNEETTIPDEPIIDSPDGITPENENSQVDNIQSNKPSHNEQTTPGIERLLEDMAQNSNGNPIIMNVVRKMQGLLTRIAELDAEQMQANQDLRTIIQEEENAKEEARGRVVAQKLAKEKLEQAIKEEQEASTLAEQAIKAEQEVSKRKQEAEERQKKLAEEKATIQKKLEEFIEL